jgi:hypothetical protein
MGFRGKWARERFASFMSLRTAKVLVTAKRRKTRADNNKSSGASPELKGRSRLEGPETPYMEATKSALLMQWVIFR